MALGGWTVRPGPATVLGNGGSQQCAERNYSMGILAGCPGLLSRRCDVAWQQDAGAGGPCSDQDRIDCAASMDGTLYRRTNADCSESCVCATEVNGRTVLTEL